MGKIKKFEGSTLIEVLIAMVVIMIVFTIAIQIFNNVLSSGPSIKVIQVRQQLEVLAKGVRQCGCIDEEIISIDSVLYQFKADESNVKGLVKLEIVANSRRTQIGSITLLFRPQKDEK